MLTLIELQSMLAWHINNCSKQEIIKIINSDPSSFPTLSTHVKDKKHFAEQSESNRLAMLVNEINDHVRNQTTLADKSHAITKLGETLTKLKIESMQLQRIKDFKEAIAKHRGVNWKTALLFNSTPATRASSIVSKSSTYKTDPHSREPISIEDVDRFQTKKTDYAYALVGNTRVSVGHQNNQRPPNESPLQHKESLNSLYSQLIFDNDERICGIVFGLNEKAQETLNNPKVENKVTYFTIKHLTRLMSTYTDPSRLAADLDNLYDLAIEEARAKAQIKNDISSVFCIGRAFLNEDGSYQIVGTNAGTKPPTLYAYDPSNRVYTALEAEFVNGGSVINQRVPAGHLLVTMSEGAAAFLRGDLPSNDDISSPEQLVNMLGKRAIAEETRQIATARRSHQEGKSFGDDFSVFALELPNSEKRESLEKSYSPSTVGIRTGFISKQNPKQERVVKKRKNKSRLKNLGMTSSLGTAAIAAGVFIGIGVALCLTGVFSPLGLGIFGAGAAIALPIAAKIAIDITLIAAAGMVLGGIIMLAGTIATYTSVGIAQYRSARKNKYHPLPQSGPSSTASTAQNSPRRPDSPPESPEPSPDIFFKGPTSAHHCNARRFTAEQSNDDLVEIVPVRKDETMRPVS